MTLDQEQRIRGIIEVIAAGSTYYNSPGKLGKKFGLTTEETERVMADPHLVRASGLGVGPRQPKGFTLVLVPQGEDFPRAHPDGSAPQHPDADGYWRSGEGSMQHP